MLALGSPNMQHNFQDVEIWGESILVYMQGEAKDTHKEMSG